MAFCVSIIYNSHMESILLLLMLAFFGATFGSFAGAQVWRLRARQLLADSKRGFGVDAKEKKRLKPLQVRRVTNDRSMCLDCHHQLKWFDLIPVVSWLSTAGRCRYCKHRIGLFEPFIELMMALLFVASYIFWPFPLVSVSSWVLFIIWLMSLVVLVVLFVYDYRWQILPLSYNIIYIVLTALILAIRISLGDVDIFSAIGAVMILGGLYALLYAISKNWVGDADRLLGVGLGLALADWRLAFMALFLANLIGCIVVLPGIIIGRLSPRSTVALGPLLIVGMLIAFFFGEQIIQAFFGWPAAMASGI